MIRIQVQSIRMQFCIFVIVYKLVSFVVHTLLGILAYCHIALKKFHRHILHAYSCFK